MKRSTICAALLLAFAGSGAAENADWKSYYDNLLKGLRSKVQSKLGSKTRISAVAAVRGERQGGDAEALYWKGGVSEEARKKLSEEKKALADAVQLAVDGRLPEGKAAIEKFMKDYPESSLLPDAREALAKLPAGNGGAAVEKDGIKTQEAPATEAAKTAPAEASSEAAAVKPEAPAPAAPPAPAAAEPSPAPASQSAPAAGQPAPAKAE